jgi:hypothetical protein
MSINVQFVRFTKAGEIRKLGFTQIGERTDSLTKANLEVLEKALDSGQLTDREGVPTTDGAWVKVWAHVSKVKPKQDMGVDDEFEGVNGPIAVNVAPGAAPGDESAPFDLGA